MTRVAAWSCERTKADDAACVTALQNGMYSHSCTAWVCECDHKLNGTGAVFFQSLGILKCAECNGFQAIRKPVDIKKPLD